MTLFFIRYLYQQKQNKFCTPIAKSIWNDNRGARFIEVTLFLIRYLIKLNVELEGHELEKLSFANRSPQIFK
jgi:hypothetical protein